jgi:hypothetical protein
MRYPLKSNLNTLKRTQQYFREEQKIHPGFNFQSAESRRKNQGNANDFPVQFLIPAYRMPTCSSGTMPERSNGLLAIVTSHPTMAASFVRPAGILASFVSHPSWKAA